MRIYRMALVVRVPREQLPNIRRDPGIRQRGHKTVPETVKRVPVEFVPGLSASRNRLLLDPRLGKDGMKLEAQAASAAYFPLRQRRAQRPIPIRNRQVQNLRLELRMQRHDQVALFPARLLRTQLQNVTFKI